MEHREVGGNSGGFWEKVAEKHESRKHESAKAQKNFEL